MSYGIGKAGQNAADFVPCGAPLSRGAGLILGAVVSLFLWWGLLALARFCFGA